MKRILLASALVLPLSLAPAFAEGVTITGSNGGTITKNRDCARADGTAECQTGTTYTGADGQTASKSRLRTTGDGQSSNEVTWTGPEGQTTGRKRLVIWGN
jgi:hypothetical protein